MENINNLNKLQKKRQPKIAWVLFALILLLALGLRFPSFFLPTNRGDQSIYIPLAMKMNYGWMQHYDIFHFHQVPGLTAGTIDYVWTDNLQLADARRTRLVYHLPLHLQPPFYPNLIWLSHGIFNRGMPYSSVSHNVGWSLLKQPPWSYLRAQFFAIIPSFMFSLALILFVYLFCLKFFTWQDGLLSALLMAGSALDIAVSPKAYADGVLSFMTFLCLFLFFQGITAKGGKRLVLSAISGLFLGLAYLTKITGILFGFGVFLSTLLTPYLPEKFFKRLISAPLWICAVTALAVAFPWLYLMLKTYGAFSINTPQDPANPWYHYVFSRPFYAYLIGIIYFMPLSLIGISRGIWAIFGGKKNWIEITLFTTGLFYIFSFILFKYTGTAGVEDRYLLPIYPLMAILAARGSSLLLRKLPKCWQKNLAWVVCICIFLATSAHSAWIGLNALMAATVIFKPFGI